MTDLFEPQLLGGTVPLKNPIVMPPMTRTRSPRATSRPMVTSRMR